MEKVYKIGDSKIHGKGLIAIKDLAAGDLVGLSHINNEATPDVGAFHNHSNNANTVNVEVGNERYLIVETPIKKGEEITVNYRLQPDLEQPEDFLDKALDGGDIDYPISGEVNYVNGDRMTLQPTRSKTYANDILGQLTYEQQVGTELPKAQRGFGSFLKPKTNSVQIGSGIGGNTILRDIKGLDKANLFHNQWYTHPDYINQIKNRNQWNLREFNQNLIYSGENSAYPLVHKSGLVKDGDGFTLVTDQIDPIAAKFSLENYQTGTIPNDYYWIDGKNQFGEDQFTPVKPGESLYEKFPFAMGMNFVNSNRLNAENLKMHGLWDEYRTKTKEIPKNLKGIWNNEFIPSWKKPLMIAKRATYPARDYLSNSFTIGGHAQAFQPADKFTSGSRGSGSSLDWKRFAPSFNAQSGFTDLPYTGTIGMNYSFLDKLFPRDQVSTVVHERGHLLDNQGGIYPNKYRHMFGDAIDWNFNTKAGKIGEKFGAGADGQMDMFNMKPYYTDPTEQYARMMEERFRLGLTPGDEYTLDMFNQNPKMFGMGDYLLKDKDGVPVNFIKNMNTIYKEGGSLLKAQDGITEFEINKHGHIETEKGYDEEALFNFVKDKYNKVDTTTQKNDLVTKLNSPAFRERYRKNVFNITGENLSEEELTNRINQQSDFTGAGPSFHVTMPYITRSSGKGYMRNTTPYISPFAGTGADGRRIGLQGNLSWMSNQGLYQQKNKNDYDGNLNSDYYDQVTNHDFPELAQYPYVPQLNLYRDAYSMGDNQVRSHDNQGNTIVHEYAHSYNTGDSPLFSSLGKYFTDLDRDEEDADGNIIRKGTYREIPGEKYKGWLSNLFGEDYFDPSQNQYGTWAMHPWEISSIKSETEAQLKNNNIWDHTKGEFTEANLDKMIKNDSRIDIGGHGRDPLNRMGYTALERMHHNNKRSLGKQNQANYILDNDPNNYIQDNIINAGDDASMDMDTFNTIFNNSQSNLKDRQKYSDYNALLEDYNGRNKRKKERATEVINAIHKAVRDQINQGYKKENEKFQIEYNKKKGEVLPKLEMYFNEIAMENGDQPIMARDGGSLPKAQGGLFKFKPRTKSGRITNIADDINLYGYNYSSDVFGNTGAMLSGSVNVPTNYAKSIRNYRQLQNTSEYDPSTRFLMNEYTVDSAPFKFSEKDWLDNPRGWQASTLLGPDGKPLQIGDNSLALALSNKIQGNNIAWRNTTNQNQPINLTRNFNLGQNTLTGIHGDINQLKQLYKTGDPFQLGSITSWGIGSVGLPQFGSDRYVIKDFDTKYPALLNEYKGLTDNQAKVWKERELLLDNPTFQIADIIENAPRIPDWRITTSPNTILKSSDKMIDDWKIGEDMWKNTGDGNIITKFSPFNKYILGKKNPYYESLQELGKIDPNFKIKAIPNYGADIELKIIKKKGGEIMKKPKYQDSPFTKGKITYSDPTKILNDLISQGIFTSEFKMGGEKKLNNGFTVKKQFDNNKNIPYVTYMNEPNIEGRIYYDSDSSENLDDFNVIDVETELIKRKIKHKRTKDIILKYESGDELSNAEKAHLNSLGLLD